MLKKISALKARQNLGQIMNEVSLLGDDFIIERAGKPMVAIVSVDKYQILQKLATLQFIIYFSFWPQHIVLLSLT